MAYMNQEKKKALVPGIKHVLKKYDMKATIAVRHYSTLVINIKSGSLFEHIHGCYAQANPYHVNESNPKDQAFLTELLKACNIGNYDNSDIMTDYFDVGWYIEVNIGKWDKPYIYTK